MLPRLTLPGVFLSSYYLLAFLAAAAGLLLAFRTLKGFRLGPWRWLLPALMAVAALVGARLWNYAVNPAQYGPSFPVWQLTYSRLSLYGGLSGALLCLLSYALLSRRSPLPLLDALVLPGGIALVLLKTGCFLNGCCFGKPTDSPWGLVFPANDNIYDALDQLPLLGNFSRRVYPTQLYEALGAGLSLAAVLLLQRRRQLPEGTACFLYAFGFTLARLLVHPLRAFAYDDLVTDIVYPACYAAILAICLIALARLHGKQQRLNRAAGDKNAPPAPKEAAAPQQRPGR